MLRSVEERRIVTLDDARAELPRTKKLFIITDMADISNVKGYIRAVSEDSSSFAELLKLDRAMQKEGLQTMLVGSYENGGGIGVQYEL